MVLLKIPSGSTLANHEARTQLCRETLKESFKFFLHSPMDFILIFLGLILVIVGIAGAFLPVLPGPLTGAFGLLLLFLTKAVPMNYYVLSTVFVIAIIIFVLDYIIPALGSKKFGGSKKGATGATIGLIIGLIVPIPLGFVIGAFAGALIGELIHDPKDIRRALKSAFGSFVGFVASTTMKLLTSLLFFGLFIYNLIVYRSEIFNF